jgi:hypothetical protein
MSIVHNLINIPENYFNAGEKKGKVELKKEGDKSRLPAL